MTSGLQAQVVVASAGQISIIAQQASVAQSVTVQTTPAIISILGQQAEVIPDPEVLIHESLFTAADGTLLDDYTPDLGTVWTIPGGLTMAQQPIINGNRLRAAADGAIPQPYVPSGVNVVKVTCDVMFEVGSSNFTAAAVQLHWQNNTATWSCRLLKSITGIDIRNTSDTVIASDSVGGVASDGVWYPVEAIIIEDGGDLYVQFSGFGLTVTTVGSGSPITTLTGNHGLELRWSSSREFYVDNFRIYSL